MGFDYYTTRALAEELNSSLTGSYVTGATSRDDVLSISIDKSILFTLECRAGGIVRLLNKWNLNIPIPHENQAERYFIGSKIKKVKISDRDRVIHIFLVRYNDSNQASYGTLICEFINRRINCALVSDRTGHVLGRWGSEDRIVIDQAYVAPTIDQRILLGVDPRESYKNLKVHGEENYGKIIRRLFSGMEGSLIKEILYRCGLEKHELANNTGLTAIVNEGCKLIDELKIPSCYIYEERDRLEFSVIKPKRIAEYGNIIQHKSIIEAINEWYNENSKRLDVESKRRNIEQIILKSSRSLRKRQVALNKDYLETDRANELEKQGHIILAQLDYISRHVRTIDVADVFDESGLTRLQIKMEVGETPIGLAERMLKKANKLKRRKKLLPSLIRKIEKDIHSLEAKENSYKSGELDIDDLKTWLLDQGYMRVIGSKTNGNNKRSQKASRPREYITGDGWRIWAGRNNKDNDVVTYRMASQNDLWFHAHGYAGSHVILRRDGRKDEPSKLAIEQAASVAAFWSKGKSAKKVSVVYTLAKYVSKPRGAAPGKALIKREKTIIVEPGLP